MTDNVPVPIVDLTSEVKIEVENITTDDNNIEVLGTEQNYSLVMYLDKNIEPKYFTKFVKAVERTVRSNVDYKMYLSAIREEPELSRDAFLHNLSSQEVEIQLHHYPFNLYSVVRIIAEKLLMEDKRVSTFIVADEVIKLHLTDKIGLVPLTVTTHELAHLGKLQFLRTQIYGSWEWFYNTYSSYMDDYEHSLVKELLERTSLASDDEDLQLLQITNQIENQDNNVIIDETEDFGDISIVHELDVFDDDD